MRAQRFYLIRPKQHVADLLERENELSRELLGSPWLWGSEEGGKTSWTPHDYMTRAKLAFLINLKVENYRDEVVKRIFSESRVSTRLFDEYWNIELLEMTGNVSEIADETLSPQDVEMTGADVVDAWLARKIASKGIPGERTRKNEQ